ncbi:related to beta transducin-like protein [Fusarium fujikuroi]|nr:related to beta transducin-like protein [Fusarium fujikuroi]
MRLINTKTLELHEFFNENTPPYAILSHAWGDQEVTFQDWQARHHATLKHGYWKILKACSKAVNYKLKWLWVDTNCINKSSSAELTEAINSMFAYYQKSKVCFAYLADVHTANQDIELLMSQMRNSRWFTRGWTLQGLIAPINLIFYAADWSQIGRKDDSVADLISLITKIDKRYLNGQVGVHEASVSKRMSWLAKRTTTRTEDMAYFMLGIFDINMPLLYGEGKRAFFRLQEEIIKGCNDHTIFCWGWNEDVPSNWGSLLAPWPTVFDGAGGFERFDGDEINVFFMTNAGLSIQLPVVAAFGASHTMASSWFIKLQAAPASTIFNFSEAACLRVVGRRVGDLLYVSRFPYPPQPVTMSTSPTSKFETESLLVMNKLANGAGLEPRQKQAELLDPSSLEFTPIHTSSDLQFNWHCAASHACDYHLSSVEGRIVVTIDKDASDWAVVLVGRTHNRQRPMPCILLGAKTKDDSGGVATGLVAAQGGNRAEARDEAYRILREWRQRATSSDYTRSWVTSEDTLGITMVMERSKDIIRGTSDRYFLCLYKNELNRTATAD